MADLLPDREARTWATLAHLGGLGFVLFGFGHIIIPLVIWLFKGDDHPFVEDQARESLNFQISVSLYVLIAGGSVLPGRGLDHRGHPGDRRYHPDYRCGHPGERGAAVSLSD